MKRKNPFETYDNAFHRGMNEGTNPFTAATMLSPEEIKRKQEQSSQMPAAVSLPPHLFIPESGQSVDIRRLANVVAGTSADLIVFTAPPGTKTKFIGYAIFSDALNFNLINFVPTLNGKRIFPFHGDPQANFKIGLGLAPDFSNGALIQCQLDMNPGEVLKWTFTNNDVVDIAAGVRMSGYVDFTIQRKTGRTLG